MAATGNEVVTYKQLKMWGNNLGEAGVNISEALTNIIPVYITDYDLDNLTLSASFTTKAGTNESFVLPSNSMLFIVNNTTSYNEQKKKETLHIPL